MTRLKALKELACKIEAGEWFPGLAQLSFGGVQNYHNALSAYHGSLDAAQALHEAALPGYVWDVNGYGSALVWVRDDPKRYAEAYLDNPARAWLLAIVRALIAQEETDT